jgi:predicted DNA-binding transcriptional regulator YafY
MPFNKEAQQRYKIIDAAISNHFRPFPTMDDLLRACEDKLGKTFAVSTIQKDIQQMKEEPPFGFNAPIKFSRQYHGYYYGTEGYSINSIPLHKVELDALGAMTDMLSAFSGSRVGQYYNQAVHKIFASVKEMSLPAGEQPRAIHADTQIGHRGFEHFEKLLHAITHKIPVNFVHYSYTHRRFNSIVAHPFLLKEFQNNWYLMAWSEQHLELRSFGLDRIFDPLYLRKAFHAIPQERIDKHFSDVYGVYPLPSFKKEKITFLADALFSDYLRANPIHASQKVKEVEDDGRVLFELNLIPSRELVNYFLKYAPSVKVMQPKELRHVIVAKIKKSMIQYRMKDER